MARKDSTLVVTLYSSFFLFFFFFSPVPYFLMSSASVVLFCFLANFGSGSCVSAQKDVTSLF